jgi:hypothetical protein
LVIEAAGVEEPALELHPLRPMRVEARRNPHSRRRERRRTKGKKKRTAREAASNRTIFGVLTAAACTCEVVIVRAEVPLLVRETLAGAKVQAAYTGRPEQVPLRFQRRSQSTQDVMPLPLYAFRRNSPSDELEATKAVANSLLDPDLDPRGQLSLR